MSHDLRGALPENRGFDAAACGAWTSRYATPEYTMPGYFQGCLDGLVEPDRYGHPQVPAVETAFRSWLQNETPGESDDPEATVVGIIDHAEAEQRATGHRLLELAQQRGIALDQLTDEKSPALHVADTWSISLDEQQRPVLIVADRVNNDDIRYHTIHLDELRSCAPHATRDALKQHLVAQTKRNYGAALLEHLVYHRLDPSDVVPSYLHELRTSRGPGIADALGHISLLAHLPVTHSSKRVQLLQTFKDFVECDPYAAPATTGNHEVEIDIGSYLAHRANCPGEPAAMRQQIQQLKQPYETILGYQIDPTPLTVTTEQSRILSEPGRYTKLALLADTAERWDDHVTQMARLYEGNLHPLPSSPDAVWDLLKTGAPKSHAALQRLRSYCNLQAGDPGAFEGFIDHASRELLEALATNKNLSRETADGIIFGALLTILPATSGTHDRIVWGRGLIHTNANPAVHSYLPLLVLSRCLQRAASTPESELAARQFDACRALARTGLQDAHTIAAYYIKHAAAKKYMQDRLTFFTDQNKWDGRDLLLLRDVAYDRVSPTLYAFLFRAIFAQRQLDEHPLQALTPGLPQLAKAIYAQTSTEREVFDTIWTQLVWPGRLN